MCPTPKFQVMLGSNLQLQATFISMSPPLGPLLGPLNPLFWLFWPFSQATGVKIENGRYRCVQHLETQVLNTHMQYF